MKCNFLLFLLLNVNLIILFLLKLHSKIYHLYCIVIRINDPTTKQILRYLKWKKYFPSNIHFFLLSMKMINNSLINISTIINVVVSFNEIELFYSNITKLKGNCSNFRSSRLLSWISHSESITLFCKKLKIKYKYIWIIEQDVGYVGDLYKFIKLYDNNRKDLITTGVGRITTRWIWYNCATTNYLTRRNLYFNNSYGYSNREYIQRWSKLYISKMMIDLQNNYHSQTETSTIELVFYHNLSYEIIPYRFIGNPMYSCKSLTEKKWINISKNKRNNNKFFHPLKF